MKKEICLNNVIYRAIQDFGKWHIYSLSYPQNPPFIVGYDVFMETKSGNMPESEMWGILAWSFDTLEKALLKFREKTEAK
jgi:hypothetical protein